MPRNRMMDYLMMRDGRNPYGSRGGYVTSGRRRRGGRGRDRGMYEDYADYEMDMARGGRGRDRAGDYADMAGGSDYARGDRARGDNARGRDYSDYASDMARNGRGGNDGHYPMMGQGEMYYPIEAMGVFNGYYGMGGEDYGYDMARGGRGGNRGGRGRDRGYDYGDYADYGGDYGEGLTREEIEHWKKKLLKEVDEKDKQFFEGQMIPQKAKQMGIQMKDFKEEELALVTLMLYVDYCKTLKKYVGANMDIYIELAKDWLKDEDSELKGSERLAVYYDTIIMGEEE